MSSRQPDGFALRTEGAVKALVRRELDGVALAAFWAGGRQLLGARGRGAVQLLEPRPGLTVVARDYRRGGALRWLLRDRFLCMGRVCRELRALGDLRAAGVAAVEPIAGLAERNGPFLRLRLCTRQIEQAWPLPEFCAREAPHRRAALRAAGVLVGVAFRAGLRHPDLHPDNVLVWRVPSGPAAEVEAALVDLDRARVRASLPRGAEDAMLVRFWRYAIKHADRLATRFSRADAVRMLAGMGLDRTARRARLARLVPRLKRSLAWHRLSWRRGRGRR